MSTNETQQTPQVGQSKLTDGLGIKWSYRVLAFFDHDTEEEWHAIHEVYYREDGTPEFYSKYPAAVISTDDGDSVANLRLVLEKMDEALKKSALREIDFVCGAKT